MASLRDFYNQAKSKFKGTEDASSDDEPKESDSSQENLASLDVENENVDPTTREVSQFERDFANHSKHSYDEHSQGLDSLFTPTVDTSDSLDEDQTKPMPAVEHLDDKKSDVRVNAGKSRDFLREDEMNGSATRQVVVINPETYEEAEVVTSALKSGDVVVVDLRHTQTSLAKRFLDFAFGATSALGGKVDVIETDVYSISTKDPITQDEIERVKREGLI